MLSPGCVPLQEHLVPLYALSELFIDTLCFNFRIVYDGKLLTVAEIDALGT